MAVIAGLALVADQIAKWLVRATIPRGDDSLSVWQLALGHNQNDGIAFGLFAGSGRAVGVVTALVLPLVVLALGLFARARLLAAVSAGLLLGGGASNLSDRVLRGEVTDYIEVGLWPSFNLADVAIVCGACLLLWIIGQDEDERTAPR